MVHQGWCAGPVTSYEPARLAPCRPSAKACGDAVSLIYLVRHGRAAAGWDTAADPPLDDLGREQAAATAAKLVVRLQDAKWSVFDVDVVTKRRQRVGHRARSWRRWFTCAGRRRSRSQHADSVDSSGDVGCVFVNVDRPAQRLCLGGHHRQRDGGAVGACCTQARGLPHAGVVVVHDTCAVHDVRAGGAGCGNGERRESDVSAVSRVLRFCRHHRDCDHLLVSRATQVEGVSALRLRRSFHHGSGHSRDAGRPGLRRAAPTRREELRGSRLLGEFALECGERCLQFARHVTIERCIVLLDLLNRVGPSRNVD
ncbi:MAG: histidine phosphatase family protein [Actinobacteria bacterium]|nr:histidine phosphatase family protein [Actinomycetota bacterium]